MAENEKKNEKPAFAEALESVFKSKTTASEKIVNLAKERDFVYDRIQETKQELEKTDEKNSVYSVLKSQLGVIEVKKEHFELDRAHLEQAVLEQASLYDLYASECAKQENNVARLKNKLEYRSAQLKIEIRTNADAAKIKMTQDQVDCALAVEPEVKQLKEEILDAEEYLGQLKAAVTAMVHKRDSIENETRLVLSKANTILGSCDADTTYDAQVKAVEKATQQSMAK